jgi:tetratricopeptide (TPR) repeat protein
MTIQRLTLRCGVFLLLACAAVPRTAAAQAAGAGAAAEDPGAVRSTRYDAQQMSTADKIQILLDKLAGDPINGAGWQELGNLYASQNDFQSARDAFIRAVQCDKTNGEFHRSLGLVFARLDMPEMALNEFNAYRQLDQFGGMDFWRLLGGAQRKSGQPDEARKTFADGLKEIRDPHHGEFFRLVNALRDLETEAGNVAVARGLVTTYLAPAQVVADSLATAGAEGDPVFTEANAIVTAARAIALEEAVAAEQSGDLDAAVARYLELKRLDPAREGVLPRLVDIYVRQGRIADADTAVAVAVREQPLRAETWTAAGQMHEQANRLNEALQSYLKAWQMGDTNDELRVAIGNLYVRLGRDAESGDWFRAGVTARTRPEVVFNYAVVLIRANRVPEAITQLRRVVAERPLMTAGWVALVQSLADTGKPVEAVTEGEKGLAAQPDPKLAFLVGVIAQKAKKIDNAIAAYELSLSMQPMFDKAQFNLGLCLMEAKKFDQAVVAFDKLVQIEGATYRAYYNQGVSYYSAGKFTEALDAFDTARLMEATPNVLDYMSLTSTKLGNKEDAAAWAEKSKELKGEKKK